MQGRTRENAVFHQKEHMPGKSVPKIRKGAYFEMKILMRKVRDAFALLGENCRKNDGIR